MAVPTDFHAWLHKLPAEQLQALRDFRRAARLAHPDDADYLVRALNDDRLAELLRSPPQAALLKAMPRAFVLAIDHEAATTR